MKICPTCHRTIDKMIMMMWLEGYILFAIISFIGGVVTYIACIIHLYSEQKIKVYEEELNEKEKC